MERYDPLELPEPNLWRTLDEDDKLTLVLEHHREAGIDLPNETVHASIHVVVENQIAIPEAPVVEALSRLTRQGLDRHEAVHAIGAVLAVHLNELLRSESDTAEDHRRYFRRLGKLTAKRWEAGKW